MLRSGSAAGSVKIKCRSVDGYFFVLKNKNVDLNNLVITLDNEIKKELPDYYLPYVYVFRNDIPVTSIDKVDYTTLEEEEYSYQKRIIIEDSAKVKKMIKRV